MLLSQLTNVDTGTYSILVRHVIIARDSTSRYITSSACHVIQVLNPSEERMRVYRKLCRLRGPYATQRNRDSVHRRCSN